MELDYFFPRLKESEVSKIALSDDITNSHIYLPYWKKTDLCKNFDFQQIMTIVLDLGRYLHHLPGENKQIHNNLNKLLNQIEPYWERQKRFGTFRDWVKWKISAYIRAIDENDWYNPEEDATILAYAGEICTQEFEVNQKQDRTERINVLCSIYELSERMVITFKSRENKGIEIVETLEAQKQLVSIAIGKLGVDLLNTFGDIPTTTELDPIIKEHRHARQLHLLQPKFNEEEEEEN
jgi:hypothetical protein